MADSLDMQTKEREVDTGPKSCAKMRSEEKAGQLRPEIYYWMPVIKDKEVSSLGKDPDDWDTNEADTWQYPSPQNFASRYLPNSAVRLFSRSLNQPVLEEDETLALAMSRQVLDAQIQQIIQSPEKGRENDLNQLQNERTQIISEMAEGHIKLVFFVLRKENFYTAGLPKEDLLQEGFLGLIKAAEKYDPEKGNKFSTYAYICIEDNIIRAIAEQKDLIRVPNYLQTVQHKVYKFGGDPEEEGLLKAVNNVQTRYKTIVDLQGWLGVADNSVAQSLDQLVSITGPEILENTTDPNSESMEEEAITKETAEGLRKTMGKLTHKQERVIALRFDLHQEHHEPLTQEEIAKIMGITKQRVEQIEKQALRRLFKNPELRKSLGKSILRKSLGNKD